VTKAENGKSQASSSRQAAIRIFNSTFVAFVVFSCILVALMTWGLVWGPPDIQPEPDSKAEKTNDVLKILIVFLFFSATIINLGIRWAARIIAARRYDKTNLRPSAVAFAVSQLVTFGVYGLFYATVLAYRLVSAGQKTVLVLATVGAVLASFYFLRLPSFLLHSAFAPPGRGDKDVEDAP